MIRVKICGICSRADGETAASAGADAIGLVFAPSRRKLTVSAARQITRNLPPYVTPVALFVDAAVDRILRITDALGIRTVQLHGDEPPKVVAELAGRHLEVVKAFRVSDDGFSGAITRYLAKCRRGYRPAGILLDGYHPSQAGGSGTRFDWRWVKRVQASGQTRTWPPLILAGGLTATNIAEAIKTVHPYAVDVSSGVERSVGHKDPRKLRRFCANAFAAGAKLTTRKT